MEASPPAFLFRNRNRKARGAKRLGVNYEWKVQEYLRRLYGERYIASPWFKYFDSSEEKVKWCQPDGLLIDVRSGKIIIVEVKLKHTPNAWWQLEHKYLPVVKKVFGDLFSYPLVEVVQWYENGQAFPVQIKLAPDIAKTKAGQFQVTIWNPKYKHEVS